MLGLLRAMTFQTGVSRADTAMLVGSAKRFPRFERTGLIVLLTTLVGVSGLLAIRRVAGALVTPLPPSAMVFAAIALAAVAAMVRNLGRPAAIRWSLRLLATLSVLVAAASLSLPGSGWLALAGLWGVVVAGEIVAWHPLPLPSFRWPRVVFHRVRPAARGDPPQQPAPRVIAAEPPASGGRPAAEVFQQFTRRQLADGAEEIVGWLRIPVAAGQRTENTHVAFCPPLAAAPQWHVRQIEGPAARMKTAQLLAYGARLDLKLTEPAAEDTSILVEFNARTNARSAP